MVAVNSCSLMVSAEPHGELAGQRRLARPWNPGRQHREGSHDSKFYLTGPPPPSHQPTLVRLT